MTNIIIQCDIFTLIMTLFWCFVGFLIGLLSVQEQYSEVIDEVGTWIRNTQRNDWVEYSAYEDLENRYQDLKKEYKQYQGVIKALESKIILTDQNENYEVVEKCDGLCEIWEKQLPKEKKNV